MKVIGLVSGSYNAQIPDVASLEQMIQDLLDYPESEPITPKIIQLEQIVTIQIEAVPKNLKHIRDRLYQELHLEDYEYT